MKNVNKQTGEVIEGKLNDLIVHEYTRPNGTRAIRYDYSNCPTLAEQHTAHLTNINYLMDKYKPDELAAYLAARSQHRVEILGHDFSKEPSLQEAKNIHVRLRKEFEDLPEDIRNNFSSHVEFLKFIDNPANQDKMIKLGILTPKKIEQLTGANLTTETTNSSNPQNNDLNDEKGKKTKQ